MEVEVGNGEGVNVFGAELQSNLLPHQPLPAFTSDSELIQQELTIQLRRMTQVDFGIPPATELSFSFRFAVRWTGKNDRVEVAKIKMVFSAKDHAFKQADIQPAGQRHIQVMHRRVFLGSNTSPAGWKAL